MSSFPKTLTLVHHWRQDPPAGVSLVQDAETLTTEQTGLDIETEGNFALTEDGRELPWVPSLNTIKQHLRLEPADTEDNTRLIAYRDAAAALLIKEIGQDAVVTGYVGEGYYEGQQFKFVKIDRSNVQAVSAVKETDSDAGETTLDPASYSVRYKSGNTFLQGEFNKDLDKEMVKVEYSRGFTEDAGDTAMLKQLMLDSVHSMYVYPGKVTEAQIRRSTAFRAAMNAVKDRRNFAKWSF